MNNNTVQLLRVLVVQMMLVLLLHEWILKCGLSLYLHL